MRKFIKYVAIDLGIGMLFFIGMLFYSQKFDYTGYMDALFVAGVLVFFVGWMLFVVDFGVFDVTMYGMKQFGLALVGKRPKKSLEEAIYNKERLNKSVYRALWVAGLIIFAAAMVMYAIYYFS